MRPHLAPALIVRLASALVFVTSMAFAVQAAEPVSVRITSPLGRTGTAGTVRIVARIEVPQDVVLGPVRFFVDGEVLKDDTDGPPFVAEWVDDNPFIRREITVSVVDSTGAVASDKVVLEPFELTEETGVFSVLLEASVQDKKSKRYIAGLDPARFIVTEDGVAQVPDSAQQEAVPATFVLLIDSSQSMSRRIDFVRQAAARLIGYLRPIDRVLVVPFAKDLGPVTGPTNDRDTVLGAITAIRASGGTAIFDALQKAADRVDAIEGRKVIILITDGYDEHSSAKFEDGVGAIKKMGITVFPVGIGGVAGISLKGERQLRQLATDTGGHPFFPPRIEDLAATYEQLAINAQSRYLLSYTPTNQRRDGKWRQVSVQISDAEQYQVTTRTGYLSPEPPPVRPAIEFTVTDSEQQLVDVTREDLVVLEDGVEQRVDTFQIAVDPIQMVLALDASGSMKNAAEAVKSAAKQFVQSLEPNDPLALMTFADQVELVHDLSRVRSWTIDAIDEKYQAVGGTALYDAIYDALDRLKPLQGRRAVIVLSDGRDENNPGTGPGSFHTLEEVIARATEVDAAIYAIGLGARVDRPLLERLAQISGGGAYYPAGVAELADQYRGILENLRRRYVLAYSSTNAARDGSWRVVEIRPRSGSLQVRSRGGYFAPEQ